MSTHFSKNQPPPTKLTPMTRGRPPKHATKPTTLTIKLPPHIKNHITQQAQAYDITITDYILTLVNRDAQIPPTPQKP